MEMQTTNQEIRKPLPIESRKEYILIKEGQPPIVSEKQKNYQIARKKLFDTYIKFSPELISTTLKARYDELDEAIANSPLKEATDRNGYSLGSLKEMTSLAIQEISGELKAKTVLKRQLEMIADEEEYKIQIDTNRSMQEGVVINNDGLIAISYFPNQDKRKIALIESERIQKDFQKGKQRLQNYASSLE